MGGTTSMFYSGAVEAAAGMAVSTGFSLLTRCKNGSKRQLEEVDGMASSTFKVHEGVDVTLYCIQQELIKLQCAINAARGRRITDQKLLEWLGQIIDESYRGNYYHRTFKHRNTLPSMNGSEGLNSLVIFPSYRAAKRQRTIGTLLPGDEEHMKLYDVLKRLKNIDVCAFLLMVNALPERPMKTYLYMDHNRLFGRDKERQQVMNFLFEPTKAGENNVAILPIVGSEGGGKTSLALHYFYDPRVQNHFSLKIYTICPHIGGYSILEEILEQCNNTYTTNYDDVNTLLVMLQESLSSERFLLVLDHICDVDSTGWNALWDCLSCGKQGSKVILICTAFHYYRYKQTVNPEAVMPVIVDGFSEDEYMLFFNEHAFGSADPGDFPELAKMGREMAKKMNGSIWGAKILGELLRDNLNAPFWSNFLQPGFLSPLSRSKDIWPVIETISLLLPKSLRLREIVLVDQVEDSHEVKTFRELMVLGPNHCTPLTKERVNYEVKFRVSVPVFPNECMSFKATCRLNYQ